MDPNFFLHLNSDPDPTFCEYYQLVRVVLFKIHCGSGGARIRIRNVFFFQIRIWIRPKGSDPNPIESWSITRLSDHIWHVHLTATEFCFWPWFFLYPRKGVPFFQISCVVYLPTCLKLPSIIMSGITSNSAPCKNSVESFLNLNEAKLILTLVYL